MNEKIERKAIVIVAALFNIYKDEEEREEFAKQILNKDDLTEDFTAMLLAMWAIYRNITEDNVDVVEFTHLLNKLAFQHLLANGVEEI